MKPAYNKILGYACIGLGLLCILSWLLNSVGLIRLGDPEAQLIMVPVCFVLASVLLKKTSQTE
jgi:hypothetical protein